MKKILIIALLIVGCDNSTEPEDVVDEKIEVNNFALMFYNSFFEIIKSLTTSLYACSTSSRFLEIESEFSIFVFNSSLIFPDSPFFSFISCFVSSFGVDLFSDF